MRRIRIGAIPAAGVGNRISDLPLTRILPKPMLPILNKPIIEYNLEKMRDLGLELIYLIVGHQKKIIQEYFRDGKDFGVKIRYISNKNPSGTGIADSIYLCKKYIKEPFMVILGDDFSITKSFESLVEKFFDEKAWVVEAVVPESDIESLRQTNCVHLEKNGRILEAIEKPERPKFKVRGCGIYVFDPIVFGYIEKTPVYLPRRGRDITVTIQLIVKKRKAYGFFLDGINININTLQDLVAAINYAMKYTETGIND